MAKRLRNVSPYTVELEIIDPAGDDAETKMVKVPPTCKTLQDAEDFAIALWKPEFPEGFEFKVVSITDHFILSDFFSI